MTTNRIAAGSGVEEAAKAASSNPPPRETPEARTVTDLWEKSSPAPQVEVRFSVNEVTHQTVLEEYDATSRQVIRQSPPEQIQKLAESLTKLVEQRLDSRA